MDFHKSTDNIPKPHFLPLYSITHLHKEKTQAIME